MAPEVHEVVAGGRVPVRRDRGPVGGRWERGGERRGKPVWEERGEGVYQTPRPSNPQIFFKNDFPNGKNKTTGYLLLSFLRLEPLFKAPYMNVDPVSLSVHSSAIRTMCLEFTSPPPSEGLRGTAGLGKIS